MTALSAIEKALLGALVCEDEHDAWPDGNGLGIEHGFDELLELILGEVLLEGLSRGDVAILVGLARGC